MGNWNNPMRVKANFPENLDVRAVKASYKVSCWREKLNVQKFTEIQEFL